MQKLVKKTRHRHQSTRRWSKRQAIPPRPPLMAPLFAPFRPNPKLLLLCSLSWTTHRRTTLLVALLPPWCFHFQKREKQGRLMNQCAGRTRFRSKYFLIFQLRQPKKSSIPSNKPRSAKILVLWIPWRILTITSNPWISLFIWPQHRLFSIFWNNCENSTEIEIKFAETSFFIVPMTRRGSFHIVERVFVSEQELQSKWR